MHSFYKALIAVLCVWVFLWIGCNDTYRPIANPIPLPTGDPGTADYVAVLERNPSGGQDLVSFIDVPGDTKIGNRVVGPGTSWISWDTSKTSVFTANTIPDTVSLAAVASTAVPTASLNTGSHPVFLYSRKPGSMFTVNQGTNTADCPGSSSVGVVLSTVNSLTNDICLTQGSAVSTHPVFLTETTNQYQVYVLDDVSNEVWVVNPNSNTVTTHLAVGTNPTWAVVSTDNKTVYILNRGSNDISVLDIATNTVVGTISTGGSTPVHAWVDTKLNRLWVVNQGDSTVSVFSIVSQMPAVIATGIPVGPSPNSITVLADGSAAWVANAGSNTVTRISGNSFLPDPPMVVNSAPGATVTWIASGVSGKKVYATSIDPTDLTNQTTIIYVSDNHMLNLPADLQDWACVPSQTNTCSLLRMRPILMSTRQ